MPSLVLHNASGGVNLFSGIGGNIASGGSTPGYYSGTYSPVGGVQFRLSPLASGNVYLAFGNPPAGQPNVTVNSGGVGGFSSGIRDGLLLAPGDSLFAPRSLIPDFSGSPAVWAATDAAASGQARIYLWPV